MKVWNTNKNEKIKFTCSGVEWQRTKKSFFEFKCKERYSKLNSTVKLTTKKFFG